MHIKWISRPHLPPLELDLADFRSLGAYQFGGHTSEGRPIYAKYRTGWLTVMLEEPDEVLLEEKIGPDFHGSMLPEQVCDLTGMTMNGQMPTISVELLNEARQQEPIFDWSGATTYWESQLRLSKVGAESLEQAVRHAAQDHNIRVSTRPYGPHARIVERPKHFDRPTLLAETICGTLHVNFPTNDDNQRAYFEELASRFLFNRIDIVDLASNRITHTHEAGSCFSRDLIDWCVAGPDRYLAAYESGKPPRMIGVKPAQDLESLSASGD